MKTHFKLSDLEKLKSEGKIRGYSAPTMTESKSKYKSKKVELDGLRFDSKKECNRYQALKLKQAAGEISELEHHKVFQLSVCKYEADFTYHKGGEFIVEDVKSPCTRKLPVYRLKKKMMKHELNIEIKEL